MSDWIPLFLLVWLVGTCAGTAFAVLLVRAGSTRPAPTPDQAALEQQEEAA